ncbi:MAG: XRE family transcriptional regulator [Kiritimatiellae bacterium]|nr:XRE family transcriptional regulator [Kiritimatiellia bacterium]
MDAQRKKKLEAAGWKFGDYADFLGMTPEEKAVVEIRIAATKEMERLHAESGISQKELARRMGTQQPNVSRLFKNPGKATLDTILQALEALGSAVPRKIASMF